MTSDTQLRVDNIARLAGEIALMTRPRFEPWAYRLLALLEPSIEWSHRGTTLLEAPVGHTVDSAGENAKHVAECSSQQDYFTTNKPIEDLDKSLKKHPQAVHIRLLAAATGGPSDRTAVDNKIDAWERAHPGTSVTLYDGRQIATEIVDRLDSDALVDALSPDLPSLRRIADENAFSHAMPRLRGYVSRPELEQDAMAVLRECRRVVFIGLSGTGKSDLAAHIAQSLDADTQVWLDASDLAGPQDLRGVPVLRRGLQHNLLYLLRERSCTAVLDNLSLPWTEEELEEIVGPRSYLIVTSQTGETRPDVVEVGTSDRTIAKEMLETGVASVCPQSVFDHVFERIGGHPLLMRILGRAVAKRDGDWEFARTACDTVITHGVDEQRQKVCRRVLMQHLPAMDDELRFFSWCHSASVDRSLLEACLSPFAPENLDERKLLAASGGGVVRLHDIVFRSVEIEAPVTPEAALRYRSRLDEFIAHEDETRSLITQRVARRHESLLLREHRRERSSSVLYALARNRSSLDVVAEFGDLLSAARALPSRGASRIELRAIIESIEATYSLTSAHENADAARTRLNLLMPAFDVLEAAAATDAMRREVRHHRAKMMVRLEQHGAAEQEFRRLLEEDPEMHAAKLQLLRLVSKKDRSAAAQIARGVVAERDAVPPTVRIAAWAELSRLDSAWVAANVLDATKALKALDHGDVTAAYDLVASLASNLSYEFPDAALEVFSAMGEGEPVLSAITTRLNWARAQVSAAKALRGDDGEKRRLLLQRGRQTYETVDSVRMPKFFRVQFAENLILLGDFDEARRVLDAAEENKRDAYWWHRSAQVEQGRGHLKAALSSIDAALDQLKEAQYRSAFLEVRFEIRTRLGDAAAAEDLHAAIQCQRDGKYKQQLESRLADVISDVDS